MALPAVFLLFPCSLLSQPASVRLITRIWQTSMAFSAFSWDWTVTPAQHAASTIMGTSGRNAFTRSAFEITQISVHSPTSVDTVRHRQIPAFLRLRIPGLMSISGKEYGTAEVPDLLLYFRYDRDRFRRSERTVYEIVLHVDHK